MDELCPLCLRVGAKRRIKAVQVNLTEALWMCENEECPWPFGHVAPQVFPRRIGEKWSFEWQMYRKVRKSVGPIPISAELSLYTPPVTPINDATTKDISKGDVVTNISDPSVDNNIFSNNSAPRDSYAPRSNDPNRNTLGDAPSAAKPSIDTLVPSEDDGTKSSLTPSSIFDIDGDEFLGDKISAEAPENSPDESRSAGIDVDNISEFSNREDKVSEEPRRPEIKLEKSPTIEVKKIDENALSEIKAVLSIRSVARANVDLQKFVQSEAETNRKNDPCQKTEFPFDIAPVTPPSEFGDQSNLPNPDLNNLKQHTTTINVEGIPPITLSYDLADLDEEKTDNIDPVTSTPIPKPHKRPMIAVLRKNRDARTEIPRKLPKKEVRFSDNKRRADNGKRYEKFSFSKLRKNVQESKDCEEKRAADGDAADPRKEDSASAVSTAQRLNFTSPTEVDRGISDPDEAYKSDRTTDESMISGVNESQSVDNLNISCLLDDMLLDYRDDSKNLNDDWLESFFAPEI